MELKSWQGWVPVLLLPTLAVCFVPSTWPRWVFMWILALTIFVGCKCLSLRQTTVKNASIRRTMGYLLAWPGMDACACLAKRLDKAVKPAWSEWLAATTKLAIGLGLLFAVVRWVPAERFYLSGWVGMVGIILVLHFGIFHLISCAWRAAGVDAKPIMQRPFDSTSISEFWGRRWNTAFRDLTYRFIFRRLRARVGPASALAIGFLISGLVHDLVISLPAGGGYGGPTAFFVVQSLGVFAERSSVGRRIGLGHGARGWLFTATLLLLPAGLLFHAPFVRQIVLPFLHAIGAVG
jgi:hypothetical protein